jgi:hypothetical protein
MNLAKESSQCVYESSQGIEPANVYLNRANVYKNLAKEPSQCVFESSHMCT